MPKQNVIILDKKNVFTFACKFLIKKENFPQALEEMKKKYKEWSHVNSLPELLEKTGWKARADSSGINRLVFNEDVWRFSAYIVLKTIAPFVEENSFIQILSLPTNSSWLYRFYAGGVERVQLSAWWIDLSDEEDVLKIFRQLVTSLASQNYPRDKLQDIIDYTYLKELL